MRLCDIMDAKTYLSREQYFGEGDRLELTVNYWRLGMLDHIERQTWRIMRPGPYGTATAELLAPSTLLAGMPSGDARLGSGVEQAIAPHGFE